MKAWQVAQLGAPRDAMQLVEIPQPDPGPDQLLVQVLAAPANFPDVLMCAGEYQVKPALPFTPGVEVCGQVVALGERVTRFRVGDRVIGGSSLPSGGFAEFALMDGRRAFDAPASLDDAEAASLYIGYQTAWFALHRRTRLQPGETLVVHAAAGGVGSAAVQIGKAAGATVIAVVGGGEKAEVARALGADVVVDRREQDFVDVVNSVTGGRGADVIYDPVGGETFSRSTKCVAFEGRILIVGFASGDIPSAALNHALVKNYSIIGLHWGLYNDRDPAAVAACHADLTRMADAGTIKPLVSERVGLGDVRDAVARLGEGITVGRVAFVA